MLGVGVMVLVCCVKLVMGVILIKPVTRVIDLWTVLLCHVTLVKLVTLVMMFVTLVELVTLVMTFVTLVRLVTVVKVIFRGAH